MRSLVQLTLGQACSRPNQTFVLLFCVYGLLKRSQQHTKLDRATVLYCAEFLDPALPPRARVLCKYAQYNVITVNTEGAAAVQQFISSPSAANSYRGQPSLRI